MAIRSNFPSIKPSLLLDFANTKALDPRITFTRSTTATYYDGVTTAKAEENLLTYSEQFDNAAWAKTNATVTANATTAPDGTTTADTINGSAGSAYILEALTVTSGITYTFSVYAKANTTNFLQIAGGSSGFGTGVWANFDLSGGTVGTTGALTTASIQSIGSGWYRCVITGTATASISPGNIFALIPVESSSATRFPTNAGTTSIYVWGAQLEQRSSATAYTATTTQAITNYIPVLQTAASGVPRFDHNPTTDESLGLLIEEQRTNICLQSEDFSTTWTNQESTEEVNVAIAPSGTLTADKLIPTTANDSHWISQSVTPTAAAHTFSFYAKAAGYSIVQVLNGTDATDRINFDLSNGTVGSATTYTGTITAVGNGWYRCTATYTTSATTSAWTRIAIVPSSTSARAAAFAGNGFSGVFLWGAQFELGAFATSYIPTVASTVTRNADSAQMTGTNFSGWFSADQGTLYAEASQPTIFASSRTVASINSTTTTSYFNIYRQSAGPVNGFTSPSNAVLTTSRNAVANTAWKASLSWQSGTVYFTAGGDAVVNAAYTTYLPSLNTFEIGNVGTGGAQNFNGQIRKIAYYPLRVTNAQLQALTS